MSENKKRKRKADEAKSRLARLWPVLVFAVGLMIFCGLAWKAGSWNHRSVDAQLAEIEAAYAIPESEDAGAAYLKLASEHLPLPHGPPVVDRQALTFTVNKPWLTKDCPKLAVWLDERQELISELLDISRLEECRLPIPSGRQQVSHYDNPARQMHGWAYLLVRSANNDAAEGRIDAAVEKYACVLRMGSHLCQQPVLSYYNNGVSFKSLALNAMKELVGQTELTDEQLTTIKMALLQPEDRWKERSRIMVKVQRLFVQRPFERRGRPWLGEWRRYWAYCEATSKSDEHLLRVTRRFRITTIAHRRTLHILIALRRFRNKTGHWPQSLDRIKPSLSKETLTDPHDNTLFVYELTGKDFKLQRSRLKNARR